jgi:hypothetical protein
MCKVIPRMILVDGKLNPVSILIKIVREYFMEGMHCFTPVYFLIDIYFIF